MQGRLRTGPLVAAALGALLALPVTGAQEAAGAAEAQALHWDARAVEHLFNRAGFGARPDRVAAAQARPPAEVVEQLLSGGRAVEPFFVEAPEDADYSALRALDDEDRRVARAQMRRDDRGQMDAYCAWWVDAMRSGADPLRDKMTLFWHGFFTSAYRDVRRSHEMIAQHRLLRDGALGSYATLLRGIVHDPAMLRYLDNDTNEKGEPNENLARELLELFSLGEGNYTEQDVQEAARALTGAGTNRAGEYRFRRGKHDRGMKRVLGERGRMDADDLVEVLLEQEACARWVARNLLVWFEGVEPGDARLDEYAALLRGAGYELKPFLRTLFLDPRFYREEIVGARVQGPIEFLVGMCGRLGVDPPARFVTRASEELGQELFGPPNVKGWEGGEAWITTSSLLQRGNVAGMLLGVVDLDAVFAGPRRSRLAEARALVDRLGGPKEARERLYGDDAPGAAEVEDEAALEDGMDGGMEPEMGGMDGGMDVGMDGGMDGASSGERARIPPILRRLRTAVDTDYRPRIHLTWRLAQAGARADEEVVDRLLDELLAIPVPEGTRMQVLMHLRAERERLGVEPGRFLEDPQRSEPVLRSLAHVILSLPEAQLD